MLMVTNSLRKYSALNLLEINRDNLSLKLSSLGLTDFRNYLRLIWQRTKYFCRVNFCMDTEAGNYTNTQYSNH